MHVDQRSRFLLMSKSVYTRIQGDIFYTLHCSVDAKNKKIAESQIQILHNVWFLKSSYYLTYLVYIVEIVRS